MPFQEVNPSNFIGSMSPHFLSIGLNSMGHNFPGNATDDTNIGTVVVEMPQGKAQAIVRADGAFGAGESLVVSARYQGTDGAEVAVQLSVLNDTSIDAAGTFEGDEIDVGQIPPGSVVTLRRVYVAGGTPNDPELSITFQLY